MSPNTYHVVLVLQGSSGRRFLTCDSPHDARGWNPVEIYVFGSPACSKHEHLDEEVAAMCARLAPECVHYIDRPHVHGHPGTVTLTEVFHGGDIAAALLRDGEAFLRLAPDGKSVHLMPGPPPWAAAIKPWRTP